MKNPRVDHPKPQSVPVTDDHIRALHELFANDGDASWPRAVDNPEVSVDGSSVAA